MVLQCLTPALYIVSVCSSCVNCVSEWVNEWILSFAFSLKTGVKDSYLGKPNCHLLFLSVILSVILPDKAEYFNWLIICAFTVGFTVGSIQQLKRVKTIRSSSISATGYWSWKLLTCRWNMRNDSSHVSSKGDSVSKCHFFHELSFQLLPHADSS